jgi:hexosaminidase
MNGSDTYSVIPKPKDIVMNKGGFYLNSSTRLIFDTEMNFSGEYLSEKVEHLTGIKIKSASEITGNTNQIILKLDHSVKQEEGYQIEISSDSIIISGKNNAGIFYGIQTLLQMITSSHISDNQVILNSTFVHDYPDFKWRGMHLDVSRHFFSVKDIKKYLDILALHKINVFHWHLTDDQGWRIEIKKYPKLTSVGAWRKNRNDEIWNISDDQRILIDSLDFYGGFYTQNEVRDIVAYAAKNHITVVPEIELPGHSAAALVAYPEFSCFGYQKEVPSGGFVGENWDFSDPYCAGNEKTFEFLQDIFDEVLELFPSEYIHIGGDECSKKRWSQCAKCQNRIKNEGLKNEFELQSYFIHRIEKYLNKKGRSIVGWEEILEGGINSSAAIMPWKGESALTTSIEAAKAGHDIIMAPSKYLYFNTQWPNDKKIHDTPLDLKSIYSYNPISPDLEKDYSKSIIGLEACVWTEYLNIFKDVEYQTMPRIAALAETGWSNSEKRDFSDFNIRLHNLKWIYRKMNINYHIPSPLGSIEKKVFVDSIHIKLNKIDKNQILRYTTNGDDPSNKSDQYLSEFIIDKSTTIKTAYFDKLGQRSKIKTYFYDKQKYKKSEKPNNLKHGIKYKLFTGKIRSANLKNAQLIKRGITKKIGLIDPTNQQITAIRFNGFLKIPENGIYTFYLASSDGSILKIGNKVVVDHDGFHQSFQITKNEKNDRIFKSGEIALEKGFHPFKINYFKWGNKDKDIRLFIKGPSLKMQEVNSSMLFN